LAVPLIVGFKDTPMYQMKFLTPSEKEKFKIELPSKTQSNRQSHAAI